MVIFAEYYYGNELQMPLYYVLFLIQIVSESFPVSSSGHVALLECLALYAHHGVCISDQVMHMLHIPTVFIIAFFFRHQWLPLITRLQKTWPVLVHMIVYTVLADIITASFYFIKKQFMIPFPLYGGFFITGLIVYSLRFTPNDRKKVSLITMAVLGLVQGCALVLPGVSRFASVYVAARWLGIAPHKAFGVTWMIQWPLIAAAAAMSLRHAEVMHLLMGWQVVGVMGVASLMALGGMYLVYVMAMREKLWWFSIYMTLPVVVSWLFCA